MFAAGHRQQVLENYEKVKNGSASQSDEDEEEEEEEEGSGSNDSDDGTSESNYSLKNNFIFCLN